MQSPGLSSRCDASAGSHERYDRRPSAARTAMSAVLFTLTALVAVALMAAPATATAASAGGARFPDSVTMGGEALPIVGVGLRSKWMVKVYAMAVYQKTPTKSASHLIKGDEPKFIWIKMLRGIDGDKMRDAIAEGLENNASEATRKAIANSVEKLVKAFPNEIPKGADIGFWYVPGRGTVLQLGEVDKARMPGKTFMSALWSIWFGREPADSDLKRDILR